jgi:mannose-P-dolichol utilization defect 1
MKVPQILLSKSNHSFLSRIIVIEPPRCIVFKARSARGLSLPAYILETLSYAITLAYSFSNGFPFSTYGENFFLTIQNTIITLLIILYNPIPSARSAKLMTGIAATVATSFVLYTLPQNTLALLQLSTLPLSLFSKLPQIRQNHRSQSTGQLSAFAVISQILGCVARLFTTATEVDDSIVAAGFALALVLNLVMGAQLWMYWGQGEVDDAKDKESFELSGNGHTYALASEKEPAYEPAPWQAQQTTRRVATPPPASGGRKWARKVD